ncbi:nucleoside recognition protein [bacterium]|nr:nucleoside recognition protein [bacterium]
MEQNTEHEPDAVNITKWQERLRLCVKDAMPPALKTGVWLLSITVPVSFLVFILKITGVLEVIAQFFAPAFAFAGLPGESAIVFATACFLNVYSSIAVIQTLGLTGRIVTILALMCLISHNLPVESMVQKKTGSSALKMIILRLSASFAGAVALNKFLPSDSLQLPETVVKSTISAGSGFMIELQIWAVGILHLCIKIMILITLLMILQRILEEFGVTEFLSSILKYPLLILGVPYQAAFLWIIANTLGLAYGSGVMLDYVKRGKISRDNVNLLNYHVAISHSLLEDTMLFVAIGVSAWWITIPRLILAAIAVWLKRFMDFIFVTKKTAAV